jgi:N-acetylglucosaminyl-diphospho-decaprenol L-rhamnosyltransferase
VLNEVSIIITYYKTPEILQVCLQRLEMYAKGAEIIVVDNDSKDGMLESLAQSHPEVKALWARNHSMADMVNVGLKAASKNYLLQMNADVFVEQDTVPAMLECLQNPKVGMVGPRCKDKHGRWQNQGILYKPYYLQLELSQTKSISVPWLSGCCSMLRRDTLEKVGGMDTQFRFYNEDLEWSWRIRKAGYECRLVKNVVTHLGGSSTPKDPKFLIEGYRGGMVLSQMYKPKWYQVVHRQVVILEAKYKQRFGDPLEKQAYREIQEMFEKQDFSQSPFGESLSEEATF